MLNVWLTSVKSVAWAKTAFGGKNLCFESTVSRQGVMEWNHRDLRRFALGWAQPLHFWGSIRVAIRRSPSRTQCREKFRGLTAKRRIFAAWRVLTTCFAILTLICAAGESLAQQVNLDSEPLQPIPQKISLDAEKVALGKDLFFDKRLSDDNSTSCGSCHDLTLGGADGQAFPEGIGGQMGEINTPTVFNSGFNFVQFWDGRAESLNDQMDGPINNPSEMGTSWDSVIARLSAVPDYVSQFERLYGGEISRVTVQDAIATFEFSLITPNSRFDQFLNGRVDALTDQEKQGYTLFKSLGCSACHQGRNIGGNMFQKFGVMNDYFAERGNITSADYGRFNVTGREEDRFVFKVPSLRNVALTAPYFHDASIDTLEGAVEIMAFYQLGRRINNFDRERLVAFLKTLTGEYQGKPLWQH